MDEDYSAVEFGKRLRKIRKKRKYTQEQIAEKLYITSESVSNFETGKTACAHEHVTKLCQILNVSADYLYFGVERELNEEKSTELDKIINSNFAHRFQLCTLKIQYLAVIQLSKFSSYAA